MSERFTIKGELYEIASYGEKFSDGSRSATIRRVCGCRYEGETKCHHADCPICNTDNAVNDLVATDQEANTEPVKPAQSTPKDRMDKWEQAYNAGYRDAMSEVLRTARKYNPEDKTITFDRELFKVTEQLPTDNPTEHRCFDCRMTKPIEEFTKSSRRRSGYTNLCRECNGIKARQHHQLNREKNRPMKHAYYMANKEKIEARRRARIAVAAVNNAVQQGKMSKQLCDQCGSPQVDFHHTEGYDKEHWFTGVWLCRPHHAMLHKKLDQAKQEEAK